jgi:hypothetical protein
MQQWARRYRELAQRRGAFHRRGRMRAFIFDGISRFGMARAVATMPTLLHISVFLFFAGLVEFLFPICMTVAYAALGCIGVFAVAYAILTVLPNIYLNCPYSTPLSGITWRITQFSVMGSLWTVLGIERLFRKFLPKSLSPGQSVTCPNPIQFGQKGGVRRSKTRSRCVGSGSRKACVRVSNSAPIEPIRLWSRVHLNGHSQLSTKIRKSKTLLHEFQDSSTLVWSQMQHWQFFPLCLTNQTLIPSSDPVYMISSIRVYQRRRFSTKGYARTVCWFA